MAAMGPRQTDNDRPELREAEDILKCDGCGTDLSPDAKSCAARRRPASFGQGAGAETVLAAEKTGEGVGKVGRGLVAEVKGFGSEARKGFNGQGDGKKE